MSTDQPQSRTVSGSRAFGRCKSRGNFENVVTVDGDEGDIDVVIIDAPETSRQGSSSQRTSRNSSPSDIICIDDEDEEIDGNPTTACRSASKSSYGLSGSTFSSEELDRGGQVFINKDFVTAKSVKQTMMQSKHGYPRNRYGLDYVSDSQSSGSGSAESGTSEVEDSDCDSSDCEIMDDKSGDIRAQWERAALRKRMSERVRFGFEDWAGFSRSTVDPGLWSDEIETNMFEVEKCLDKIYSQHFEGTNAQCSPSNSDDIENDISSGAFNADELTHDIPMGEKSNKAAANLDPVAGIVHEGHAFGKEGLISKECSDGRQSSDRNQFNYKTACSHEHVNKVDEDARGDDLFSLDIDELDQAGTSFCTAKVRDESSFMHKEESYPGRPSSIWRGKELFSDSSELVHGKPPSNAQPPYDYVVNHKVAIQKKDKSFDEEMTRPNNKPTDELQLNNLNSCSHNSEEGTLKEPPGNHCAGNATERSCSFTAEPEDESQVRNDLIGEHSEWTINRSISEVQNDLIADREKHKESIEYKRAQEEEWASRQRQLQIQAEEAQRLRKRRKAEIMRLLNMEKRQKQRLEEIRESQKKDQETTNLKEQLRLEVRKELDKMEGRYRDMASLLRGLGIHIEGGLFPSLHEVSAAYKQALRRFHPDRVCRSDIHQQVKAEETFKFISRLKEKLLPLA
ncbi:uncharacterized protein [Typha angustifolia]|uniref:uncharacterized protein n=1 Tax=Typha angustifolia TaxID=59011 RepID=UPI003C2F54D0